MVKHSVGHILEMVGLIDMEQKWCETINHDHGCDLWVTMVGWVDVQHNAWSNIRCWHLVSSLTLSSLLLLQTITDFCNDGNSLLYGTGSIALNLIDNSSVIWVL